MTVVCFESRRSVEIAELVRRHGGAPVSAPAMREVPLEENGAASELARRLAAHEIDVVVLLTGVGTRLLVEAVAAVLAREELAAELRRVVTVARGPKPRAALRELGLEPTIAVGEPNTWRELLAAIDARGPITGQRVAVQEYGEENPELLQGLAARGASVLRVPIYRWALPDDLAPLREAIRALAAGEIDVALFTSATQVEHLFRVAGKDAHDALSAALGRVVVASIGPICSRALERHGVKPDFEPDHPKMGHLVRAASDRGAAILRVKRETAR